jgi:hypothetical protein
MKSIRVLTIKPLVKETPSKPKVALSKADPDFYAKLGAISAEKRHLPSDTFSAMASLSHPRKRKTDGIPL